MGSRKEEAVRLINEKLAGRSFLSYIEIAEITGYHPKYVLKLKKEVMDGSVSFVHGNKNRKPVNVVSDLEKEKIIGLYKRSHCSIRKFCNFYARHSYSCIYNIIKEYEASLSSDK